MQVVEIKLNEKKEIKVSGFHLGYSIDFLDNIDGLTIKIINELILVEATKASVNDKTLKYEIKDLDDNFIDDGILKFELILSNGALTSLSIEDAENVDSKTSPKEFNNDEKQDKTIQYPKKLEIKKGETESILLAGVSDVSKIVWSSEDIDDFEDVINVKNNGMLILINTKDLDLGIYTIEFQVDNQEKHVVIVRILSNKSLSEKKSVNKIENNTFIGLATTKNKIENENIIDKEAFKARKVESNIVIQNEVAEEISIKEDTENIPEKKKEVFKPIPDNLILEVFSNNRFIPNLSMELSYSDSILIGKRSASAKAVDIDLKDVLNVNDKCSRNQLKIFRDENRVILKNTGSHRVFIKNRDIELFPKEHIYLELGDEIIIGKSIKVILIENN